jgi:ERAP1-like C-terminal domain
LSHPLIITDNTFEFVSEQHLQIQALPAEDRAGLISDVFALTKAGKMKVEELVSLLPAYKDEDNSTV